MMCREILSKLEFLGEFHADTVSVWATYTLVFQKMIVLEYSSDSDDVNIRPTKRQNASVIDSDVEREHKTRSVGEHSFASTEGGTEDNISQKSEDFTGVGGVTTEGNNPQRASEKTELIFGRPKEKSRATGVSFCKKPSSVVS